MLRPDLDQVEALAPEREALWTRLEAASFLTDDEKRAASLLTCRLRGGVWGEGFCADNSWKI